MESFSNKFNHRISSLSPSLVKVLAEIDGIKGAFSSVLKMKSQNITELKKSVLVTSAASSTRIEGATLTDNEVKKVFEQLNISKFEDRDSQEVQGYLEVLQNVFEGYEDIELRESSIISIHQQLLKYSSKDHLHRGSYKKKENIVGILGKEGEVKKVLFETTPAYLAQKEMQELVEWTNWSIQKSNFHYLLSIANFIIEFLKIHPFEDGNGRLSRVLTNLLLLKGGYNFVQFVSHEQIIEKRKDEYYFALRISQSSFGKKDESIESWLNFFLSVLNTQAKAALNLLESSSFETTLSKKQLAVWNYIQGSEESTPKEIAESTEISMATVRQALNRLMELNKIRRIGRGRATRYVRF